MTFTLTKAEEIPAIPANEVLQTEIVTCEERETPFWIDDKDHSKGKQRQVSFRFRVTEDGEYYGRTLFGNTTTTFSTHPDCKLRIWVQEILDLDVLPEGFAFEPSDLEGLAVKVVVGNRPKTNQDGSQSMKDFAEQVIRLSKPYDAADLF